MVLTTLIMGFVMFRIWRLRMIWAGPLYVVLLASDAALFGASATKIPDGAWLPLVIAAMLMLLFTTWARGRTLLAARLARDAMPVESFLRATAKCTRVPGLAVYFTRDAAGVPTALLHSLKHHHVLHEHVLLLTIRTALLPHVLRGSRLRFEEIGPSTGRAVLTFGFLDEPDVPEAWGYCRRRGSRIQCAPATSSGGRSWSPPHDLGCRCGARRCLPRWYGSQAPRWSISACHPGASWNWEARSRFDSLGSDEPVKYWTVKVPVTFSYALSKRSCAVLSGLAPTEIAFVTCLHARSST